MIRIASTGTGSTDGLASQLLCKLNAILLAGYFGYKYVEIPFDDYLIKGNSGHRYGNYSTALQNLVFSFPGFDKINPIIDNYQEIKILNSSDFIGSNQDLNEIRKELNEQINSFANKYKLFVLNGFSNIFADKAFLYNKLARGGNVIVDPRYLYQNFKICEEFKIGVHIRRGDIVTYEVDHNRIIPMSYFNRVTENVINSLNSFGINSIINLHIEGSSEGFSHTHNKFDDINPIASFLDLMESDLIISSKSSHSSVPSMLSGKLMIFPEDTWMPRLPAWIPANKEGNFEFEKLSYLLKTYHGNT